MLDNHIQIGKYKLHHHHLLMFVIFTALILISVLAATGINMLNAATSPWNQSDWSSGVGGSTSNQYLSETNIDNSVSGEVSLDNRTKTNWYNISWKYRRKILFNNTDAYLGMSSENLTNFVTLIKLENGVNFNNSKAKSAGEDIRFTDSDGTTLIDYEIESWNLGGNSYVWVKVPQIDINSSTDFIYVYYGNPSASTTANPSSVWSGYSAVYHLKENSDGSVDDIKDSSSNLNHMRGGEGTATKVPTQATGAIGNGLSFDNIDDYAYSKNNGPVIGTGAVSYSIWYKTTTGISSSQVGIFGQGGVNNNNNFIAIFYRNSSPLFMIAGIGSSTSGSLFNYMSKLDNSAIVSNTWYHYYVVRSGTEYKTYLNGNLIQNLTIPSLDLTTGPKIGMGRYYSSVLTATNGTLDEARLMAGSAKTNAWIKAEYLTQSNTFQTYQNEEEYYTSGEFISNVFDTEQISDWGNLTFTHNLIGTYEVRVRTGFFSNLSDATDFSLCNSITSGTDLSGNNCVSDNSQYVQYKVNVSTAVLGDPVFEDIVINFSQSESSLPATNATNVVSSGINSNDWINYEPTITWDTATDNIGGSGILGYCIALDEANPNTSSELDPAITSGALGLINDNVAQSFCPYISIGETLNISTIPGLTLTSDKAYNLSIKAVDKAGNIFTSGTPSEYTDLFKFKYDSQPPNNPSYLSLPGNFVSSKDVTFTWPVASGGASDSGSLVAGLQYRIGDSGTWMGDLHLGSENINDLLANDGTYTFDSIIDYPEINDGLNNIYLRTLDNAGNISIASLNAILKINTNAPSEPLSLSVTPSSNATNNYSFSWQPPATYTGSVNSITYCYTINELPSLSDCNYTPAGSLSLANDAYANQPGTNTFYIVARDEALNINYSVYSSITFSYNGDAPGMPQNLNVSDISIKNESDWRLVVSWLEPENLGAGVSTYKVFRSNINTTCSVNPGAFTEVGSTTAPSKIYSDTGLTQQTYYYCTKACDNANNCGAYSSTSGLLPTGKFIEPAILITEPSVSAISTQKAVINWTTDRASDSRIEYGLSSGEYFDEEVGSSNQVQAHTVSLNNLTAGTSYYYRAKWTDEDGNTGISEEKSFVTSPPPQLIEVNANSITVSSALIRFTSKSAYKAVIFYGKTTNFGSSQEINISPVESNYTIPLTELDDESKYYYSVSLIDLENVNYPGDTYSFTTLAKPRIENVTIEEQEDTASPTVRILWTTNVNTTSVLAYNVEGDSDKELQVISIDPTTIHSLDIVGLKPTTNYELRIRGVDNFGNLAESSVFKFTTSTDNRAPLISNVIVESNVINNSTTGESSAQLIVSWETDEPSTSLVAFGEGSSGSYTQTSQSDLNFKQKHVIIVNDLSFSTVYSLQIQTKDQADNERTGSNFIAITPNKTENALDLVIINLRDIFGFLNF